MMVGLIDCVHVLLKTKEDEPVTRVQSLHGMNECCLLVCSTGNHHQDEWRPLFEDSVRQDVM